MAKQIQTGEKKKSVWRKIKESFAELRNVTWPKLPVAVKKTSSVLGVVVFFGVILFAIDRLLAWIYSLLMSGLV